VPGSHEGYAETVLQLGAVNRSLQPAGDARRAVQNCGRATCCWSRSGDGALYRAPGPQPAGGDAGADSVLAGAFATLPKARKGQLLLWTDRGALLEVETDNEVSGGETLFQACSGCHMIGDGESNGIGPDLRKVCGTERGHDAGVSLLRRAAPPRR